MKKAKRKWKAKEIQINMNHNFKIYLNQEIPKNEIWFVTETEVKKIMVKR